MTEFNPNCGKCGMLNSRGVCSLTACRYPSNVIVAKPKVIRGMMVNPQTNADRIRTMTDEELAELIGDNIDCSICKEKHSADGCPRTAEKDCYGVWLDWLKSPSEVGE